ncbi:site-specific DNA-methyltransferase [Bartonella gabonensis]|uniref:site-specific DNA-methyltransferase n=1 Tax=Bartonella gabonensis TaxID=2699889 RepID=UPI001FECF531|nr:site-specific DNA-methyltransferase [Bartonella gabonensis]
MVQTGNNVPSRKRFLSEVKDGMVSMTIWPYTEVGHNQDAKREVKAFNSESVFTTPKPERLMERIINLQVSLVILYWIPLQVLARLVLLLIKWDASGL